EFHEKADNLPVLVKKENRSVLLNAIILVMVIQVRANPEKIPLVHVDIVDSREPACTPQRIASRARWSIVLIRVACPEDGDESACAVELIGRTDERLVEGIGVL